MNNMTRTRKLRQVVILNIKLITKILRYVQYNSKLS